jgi:hypothetical protein
VTTSWEAEKAGMSCVEITHDMATLLVALRSWPHVDMQDWGWIEESGELTESGARHAGFEVRPGISK